VGLSEKTVRRRVQCAQFDFNNQTMRSTNA
jgi:hypothetical protein